MKPARVAGLDPSPAKRHLRHSPFKPSQGFFAPATTESFGVNKTGLATRRGYVRLPETVFTDGNFMIHLVMPLRSNEFELLRLEDKGSGPISRRDVVLSKMRLNR